MLTYVNSQRPRSSTRLRPYLANPNLRVRASISPLKLAKASSQRICEDLNSILWNSVSTRKLPVRAPGCSRDPMSSRGFFVIPNKSGKTYKLHVIERTDKRHLSNPPSMLCLPNACGPTVGKRGRRTVLSKEGQTGLNPTHELKGLSNDFYKYRQRCLSADISSVTENSQGLIHVAMP